MKLATYKDGSRDGQLLVVSRDLSRAHYATGMADRMQQVLDDWNFISPQLQDLYDALNGVGDVASNSRLARHVFPFDPQQCMAPLPRAPRWVGALAYRSHIERIHQALGLALPQSLSTAPWMEAGASDDFSGPCDALRCGSEALELDFEAQLAVITGDVPRLASATQALEGIRLVVLANAVRLRSLSPGGLSTGLNLIQGKPAIAFSPVALTLDEFGTGTDSAWNHGRLNLTLQSSLNGRRLGRCEAGPGMNFHFGELIAELCATRPMRAGTVLGSGPVSNQDASLGFSCIAEMRAMEILRDGQPATGFLKHGDVLRIEMKGRDGQSMFGVIEQQITPFQK